MRYWMFSHLSQSVAVGGTPFIGLIVIVGPFCY